jgi:hypothetical protein
MNYLRQEKSLHDHGDLVLLFPDISPSCGSALLDNPDAYAPDFNEIIVASTPP